MLVVHLILQLTQEAAAVVAEQVQQVILELQDVVQMDLVELD
jgi:hypothetical protein